MQHSPQDIRRALLQLRQDILAYTGRTETDTSFCDRCTLPFPEDEFESYEFCPWCSTSVNGMEASCDESRKVIEHEWDMEDEIQCGECGGEYNQPSRYPFPFCPHCGAPFAADSEFLIVLPFVV